MEQIQKHDLEIKEKERHIKIRQEREIRKEEERIDFEKQQADAILASHLSAYEVRAAWNRVNRAIRSRGKTQMGKLFLEFDTDGGGTVDRNEFKEGLARLGVKLSGPEFEACWQYADPRGEGELSKEYFIHGLGEIDPEVDAQSKAFGQKALVEKQQALKTLAGMDVATGVVALSNEEEGIELHDAWLALCKYFGKGKARALATFKQIDTDKGGSLDETEFRIFIAMLNLKLSDKEQAALWSELDADGSGELTFPELSNAVADRERRAAEEKADREAAKTRAAKALVASAEVTEDVIVTADVWEAMHDFTQRAGPEGAKEHFLSFDSTGHGTLSRNEFRNALLAGPKLDLDDEMFERIWLDIDLTGHEEIEFEEFFENTVENHKKAEQVIAGAWLPSEKDKQKAQIKKETVKRKEKEAAKQASDEKKAAIKAARDLKRGKLAKVSGNEQIKMKALQLLRRRQQMAKEKSRMSTTKLDEVPFSQLRGIAITACACALLQYYLSTRVYWLLEETGPYTGAANFSILGTSIWAIVLSFTQHWAYAIFFFIFILWTLFVVACNILTNVNTYIFFQNIATECYSPIETSNALNYCYDNNGKSDAECVCTDKASLECYEFTPGKGASGTCDPAEASTELLIAALGAVVCFIVCLMLWFLVGCFGPIYGRTYGFYYLIFARDKLKKSLQDKTVALKDNHSLALREYNKKKKAQRAKGGFEELVSKLNKETNERGGPLDMFKEFDKASRGALSDLEFRAGLQDLGIKANAADMTKLWDFMDSDHGGNITFADFAAGLKAATKNATSGDAADLEAGEEGTNEDAAKAWAKLQVLMDKMGLEAADFFSQKLDVDGTEDLDQADFEESLASIGLVLLDEEVQGLWESTVVPPNDMINAHDFETACSKHAH